MSSSPQANLFASNGYCDFSLRGTPNPPHKQQAFGETFWLRRAGKGQMTLIPICPLHVLSVLTFGILRASEPRIGTPCVQF